MARTGNKNPSAYWYFNDWENDEALKSCSLATQGAWARMLCVMARSIEPGVLIFGNFPADRDAIVPRLAVYLGRPLEEVAAMVDELLTSTTASLDEQGRIINRRMRREWLISQARAEAGRRGAASTNAGRQKSGKHPGKTDGKSVGKIDASISELSGGNTREIRDENTNAGRQNSGKGSDKAAASSLLHSFNDSVTESLTETSRAAPRKATALPEDWKPDDKLRQWTLDEIAKKGATGRVSPGHELEQFKDHAAKNGRTAKSWPAAWRMWIRNAIRWSEGNGKGNRTARTGAGARRAAALDVLNREARGDAYRPRDGATELPLVGSASLVPDEEPT
jgi:hypothetical protein